MKFQLTQKIPSLLLGLTPIFTTATLIPLSVVTIPLVFNQPVHAQCGKNDQNYQIFGAIFDKWAKMGGGCSPLGNPTSDEVPAARGGRYNTFQSGFIYWHPKIGAYAIYGKIAEKWYQLGAENGFGYPITDELPAANGGRFNDFEKNASIYWHPNIGTYAVYGDIRSKWVSMGREKSRLGYPISDEQAAGSAGQRVSHFQGGSIYWNSATRETIVTYNR